ncbi:MAG TPA: hypothetical protein VNJ02_05375 [Vicinamibacterales bacterium]|nr:hypothetical protein [Vicinamibacterales bacterium]
MKLLRFAVAVVMLTAAATAAPDAQGPRRNPGVPSVPVTTQMVLAKPAAYAGQSVTLSSGVDEILSKTAFTVDQRKVDGKAVVKTGKPLLVIAPTLDTALAVNNYLTIVGAVMKFDAATIASKARDYQLDLPPDVAAKYQGQTVLLATSIMSSTSTELTRKPTP